MWYARVEGRPGVFVLSNPDFNALRQPLWSPTPAPNATPAARQRAPAPSLARALRREVAAVVFGAIAECHARMRYAKLTDERLDPR